MAANSRVAPGIPAPTGHTRRHLIVGAIAVGIFAGLVLVTGLSPERWVDIDEPKADSWLWRLSVSSADAAVVLLAVTVLSGPATVFRGGRPRVHVPVRRVMGIWGGGLALFHVALAMFVHADWQRVWTNWLALSPPQLTGGFRGAANWVGLVMVGVVILLLWLSRDAALRHLGARRWKRLQRSSYLLMALIVVHVLLYHRVERRLAAHRVPVLAALGLVGALQLMGFIVVRRRARA